MTTMREAIREHHRLGRMRQGQDVPEMVTIPSLPEVRCAQVPLMEAEVQQGVFLAANLDVPDNIAGLQLRNRAAFQSDVFHSLREPGDPTAKVFESIEEMIAQVQPEDIDYLADNLMLMMDYASPAIDGMSDKELEALKKAFAETDWSVLTGRRWAAVKLCCQVLFPDLLLAKSLGTTSTESSTPKNGTDESISDV